jgi:GNAT superfamily N-acetyltransferase
MDRLAELAGYAQSFPGMVDEDFIAAGFTPEEVSSYRSQTDPQRMTPEEISLMADRYGTLQEPNYNLGDLAVQGTQDILSNTFGMNPYNAGVLSRKFVGDPNSSGGGYGLGLLDLTGIGGLFAIDRGLDTAFRGSKTEDPVTMGLGALETILGVAEVVPVVGTAVKPLSKAVIRTVGEVFDSPFGAEVIGNLRAMRDLDVDFLRGRGDPALAQGVGADVPGRPPLTFDEVEAVMKAEAPAKPTAAELRRQANIQRFGYDPSEVVERTPTDDAGFEAYLEKVNPGMKRIAEEARPNLMMGDMYGMMPKGSEVVGSKGNVTFHRSPNGEYYATAFNPDVNEEDVIGYITDRGDGTELAVVSEMQGQGVGGELQYLFRKENPNAPTGGLTEAGEGSLRRTYKRLADEGIIGGDVGFDVVRKDASSIFGEGSERVRYTDPKTGGTIEVVVRSDGSASVLELEVPEDFQGQGVGQKLQQQVMEDFPMMGGQVSSKAAATTAYRLGRRPPGKPNATLDEVFAEIDEMSSVNMVSPDMQTRFGGPTAPAGIKAYQGSPHNFAAERLVRYPDGSTEYIVGSPDVLPDIPAGAEVLEDFPLGRMRMDKIGTGEGAQAYGQGMYVAEAEDVAKGYKDNISSQALDGAQAVLQRVGGDVDAAIADRVKSLSRFEERYSQGDIDERLYQFMKNLGRGQIEQLKQYKKQGYFSKGHMYEININANPDDFLDWDKTVGSQSQNVKSLLGWTPDAEQAYLSARNADEDALLSALSADASGQNYAPTKLPIPAGSPPYSATGREIAGKSNLFSSGEQAAEVLKGKGIPGIKYLDQVSRSDGAGTRNFVVFDEKLISIVKKYGIAGAATMLGVSALDVEQALADNLAPSDWEDLVAGPQ